MRNPKTHYVDADGQERAYLNVNVAKGLTCRVRTLEDAAHTLRAYIQDCAIGSNEWDGTGNVREMGSKKIVARIAYNGTIFNTDGTEWHA